MEIVLTPEQIARVCHEANRAHCMNIGDHSQPTWDMAPEWQKRSAVAGVEAALADPKRTPEASHEAWMEAKLAAGWKRGPVKAPDLKEHPCLVPYDGLPDGHKVKDVLFLAVVGALRPLTLEQQVGPSKRPPEPIAPRDGDATIPGIPEAEAIARTAGATGEEDLPEAEIVEDELEPDKLKGGKGRKKR